MSVVRRDYYEVLGVPPDADGETIRKAFRTSARRLHPDVSAAPDAEDRFRELAEAYSVLSRSTSRVLYDHLGYRGRGHGGVTPFGRHARRRADAEARDAAGLAAEVRIPVRAARRGTSVTVRPSGAVRCRACAGRGEGLGAAATCRACEGTGRLRRTSTAEFGRVLQVERCYVCDGRGRAAPPCAACGGTGRRELRGEVVVTIPPGVADGSRVPLVDGGEVVVRVGSRPEDDREARLVASGGFVASVALLVLVVFFW